MNFLREMDVPARPNDILFREARLGRGIAAVVITAGAAALGAFSWQQHVAPVLYCFFPFMVLIGFFFIISFFRSLGPNNWLMRLSDGRLYIKFRSFLNSRLPEDDLTVIQLQADDIVSVEEHEERRQEGRGKNEISVRYQFLDIMLREPLPMQLVELLNAERQKMAPDVLGRSVWRHYPVALAAEDVIRVEWRGGRHPLRRGSAVRSM